MNIDNFLNSIISQTAQIKAILEKNPEKAELIQEEIKKIESAVDDVLISLED